MGESEKVEFETNETNNDLEKYKKRAGKYCTESLFLKFAIHQNKDESKFVLNFSVFLLHQIPSLTVPSTYGSKSASILSLSLSLNFWGRPSSNTISPPHLP